MRHPAGVVFIMMIYRFPGSSALRASTPGLKDDDPSGAPPLRDRQAALHPDRGARSIGIGHPRSGDRCTAPHPAPSTPAGRRRAEIPLHDDPQGVETYLVWIIHRSSALRASTDAYGAGILSDAGVLCEPISLGRASDASARIARPAASAPR